MEAGLDDFGDLSFMEPLQRLVKAIVTEANLSPMGLLGTRARMVTNLVNRLRLQRDLKLHPEILKEDVSDPIIIIGLPRTGTSKLQRMMSRDPAVQRTPFWKMLNPAPLPGWKRGEPDARIALAEGYAQAFAQNPDFIATHPMAADETEEDVFMMDMTFDGIMPIFQYHIPSFQAWVMGRDRHDFYAFEKVLFQYLQWQDGGRRGRPWVWKAVSHLGGVQALINNFPGVTFVHTHRDVSTCIASTMRTGEAFLSLLKDNVDLVEHGTRYMSLYTDEMASYLKTRERLGSKMRVVDVSYADIVADPLKVIRHIRAVHGVPVTPEGERAMLSWSEENPQYRFGKVTYSPERYGLTKAKIEDTFADYRQKFAAYI